MNKDTGEIVFLRTPYNYDADQVSIETGLHCTEPSMAKQEFKEETDINTIVERFGATGELPPAIPFPTEQDFTETYDFQSAMNVIVEARESFMTMDAKTRARFNNDPQRFMEFIHDGNNADEAIKMGLAIKVPEPEKKPEEKPAKEEKKE